MNRTFSLQIIERIKINVMDNTRVRRSQVNAYMSERSARAVQNETRFHEAQINKLFLVRTDTAGVRG